MGLKLFLYGLGIAGITSMWSYISIEDPSGAKLVSAVVVASIFGACLGYGSVRET